MQKIILQNKTILVTGAAGFIGSNLILELLKTQSSVNIVGIDNMNNYYDVSIKQWRLSEIEKCAKNHVNSAYTFIKGDISDKSLIDHIFAEYNPAIVVNLAAQAGVRYSITNPDAYIQSNLIGFYNILEACRHSYNNNKTGVEHLVYASSSSVYGSNKNVPYSTDDKVDNPVSLYAATKKSNELMAHAYSKLYNIPSTGLRFLPYMDQPEDPIWLISDSQTSFSKVKLYRYSIMEIVSEISHILMTLSRELNVLCRVHQKRKTVKTGSQSLHMLYII